MLESYDTRVTKNRKMSFLIGDSILLCFQGYQESTTHYFKEAYFKTPGQEIQYSTKLNSKIPVSNEYTVIIASTVLQYFISAKKIM